MKLNFDGISTGYLISNRSMNIGLYPVTKLTENSASKKYENSRNSQLTNHLSG